MSNDQAAAQIAEGMTALILNALENVPGLADLYAADKCRFLLTVDELPDGPGLQLIAMRPDNRGVVVLTRRATGEIQTAPSVN